MGSEVGGHESPLLSETSAMHHQCHRVVGLRGGGVGGAVQRGSGASMVVVV